VTTYEIVKNGNSRTVEGRNGRIYERTAPFWCLIIDGEWDGYEYRTKREAKEEAERKQAGAADRETEESL